jgi:hypothetical protein
MKNYRDFIQELAFTAKIAKQLPDPEELHKHIDAGDSAAILADIRKARELSGKPHKPAVWKKESHRRFSNGQLVHKG